MADATPPTPTGETGPIAEGASVSVQYARRVMKMYAINESEVATISSFNAQATAYFSLASFAVTAALSIFANAIFYTSLTPAGTIAEHYAVPILVALALIFSILGVHAIWRRSSLWTNIKSEAR